MVVWLSGCVVVWLDEKLVGNRLGEEGRRRGDLGLAIREVSL